MKLSPSKYIYLSLVVALTAASCKKSAFVSDNINPSILTAVDPGAQFLYGSIHFTNDFEFFYDYYQYIMPWMQYSTSGKGNSIGFSNQGGNFNYRYSNFYTNVGLALEDIPHLIAKMPATQAAGYVYENAIASIARAYYAFYVSDVDGSVPYSQAFLARYGGTLTPVYDPQQMIFDSLDIQIKNAVTTLEATQSVSQASYAANDPFYGGNVTNWIKAGNALRLKIAMRSLKRNASGVATIVQSVLGDANQMDTTTDGWVLLVGPSFATQTSNYNPTGVLAAKPMVDFMNKYADPRLPIYYRPNSQGVYVGSPTDPDTCALPYYQSLYAATDTPFSQLQHRLFTPNYNENDGNGVGSGVGFFCFLTYAEYCFIRADLAARGVTTDNAGTWYTKGVTASINFYNVRAQKAGIAGFNPVTAGQITAYLNQTGIAFDPTKATEQIACQANIDFFRQPNEAWAWWKRTGFPNTTSVLPWSPLTANGTAVIINRRTALSVLPASDANYANQQAAYQAMAQDPGWGGVPGNAQGRVWWDMQ
ncbi:MAG TPA: SusD/RagB family nutrient-binding outer membrane lipoprotein [Puia sp.]|jgi:hypothetical protein|nr:SusD/RagB family nutrient-binding outer membrane lipoprotein [Puia sp.]